MHSGTSVQPAVCIFRSERSLPFCHAETRPQCRHYQTARRLIPELQYRPKNGNEEFSESAGSKKKAQGQNGRRRWGGSWTVLCCGIRERQKSGHTGVYSWRTTKRSPKNYQTYVPKRFRPRKKASKSAIIHFGQDTPTSNYHAALTIH